jgi:hypothetical protein
VDNVFSICEEAIVHLDNTCSTRGEAIAGTNKFYPACIGQHIRRKIMSQYEAPRSDAERLTMIRRSIETGQADRLAGLNYLEEDLLTQLGIFAPKFADALDNTGGLFTAKAKAVREKDTALDNVITHMRDLWEGIRRRVNRLNLPAEVLTFYKLSLDGTLDYPTSESLWLTLGDDVVKGDADAVAAGYQPMVNPSAAELQAVLVIAKAKVAEVVVADRAYDQAQEQLAVMRGEADAFIQEIMDQLRYQLRKKEEPNQRRVMRTYGATFSTQAGGQPDEVSAPEEPNPIPVTA